MSYSLPYIAVNSLSKGTELLRGDLSSIFQRILAVMEIVYLRSFLVKIFA